MNSLIEQEKTRVALISLFAAIFLTLFKLMIGITTHSIGILSEAAHSAIDLVAAFFTWLAIKKASQPPDEEHHYGHGRFENISALFATILLLLTSIWIVHEVLERFKSGNVEITVNSWSFIVIISSILIDATRANALNRAAKKYNSQALQADALHFSSDILSSSVVLLGLISYAYGYHSADSYAALGVAVIVIFMTLKLGKQTIDVLLDKAPEGIKERIVEMLQTHSEITSVHDIRVRNSGPNILIELNIHVDPNIPLHRAHAISDDVEKMIANKIDRSTVHIHVEPEGVPHE